MNPVSTEIWENKEVASNIFRMRLRPYGPVVHVDPGRFFMIGLGPGHDPLLRRPLGHMGVTLTSEGIHLHEFLYEVRGRGTEMLSRLQPPRVINIIGPLGSGWKLTDLPGKVILVAGGMGMVPLYSAAKLLALQKDGPEICYVYGARTGRGLVLCDELESVCDTTLLCTEDGCKGEQGLVTELLEKELEKGGDAAILACGPRPMLKVVARIAARDNIPCQVSLEARMACGMGACLTCSIRAGSGRNVRVCKEGPVFDSGDIDWEALDESA